MIFKFLLHTIVSAWKKRFYRTIWFKYRSKNTDLKIILLDYQNICVENWSMMSNAAKYFDILVINLSIIYSYFDGPIKFIFKPVFSYIFILFQQRYFSKIVPELIFITFIKIVKWFLTYLIYLNL